MNRPNSLRKTLESIFNFNHIPNDVIIVDQSDESLLIESSEISKTFNTNFIRVLRQSAPSLTKARNLGLYNVKNDFVMFLDDDIDFFEDTLINSFNRMKESNFALIAVKDLNSKPSNRKISYLFFRKSYLKRNIGHVSKSVLGQYPLNLDKFTNTEWAMGFCFIINKKIVDKENILFDEKLLGYAYAEDLDFTFRLYRAATKENLECIYDPHIKVRHLISKEFRISSQKQIKMYVYHRYYISIKLYNSKLRIFLILFSDFPLLINIFKKESFWMIKAHIYSIANINKIKKGVFNY